MIIVSSDLVANGSASTRLELRAFESGAVVPLHILEVQNNWIRAVVPEGAPLGPAAMSLSAQGGTEESDVVIVPSAVSIFAKYEEGAGPALAQVYRHGGGPTLNSLTNPALPGDTITWWLTGLGEFGTTEVSIDFGGQLVAPVFAGHAPNQPGTDQINFVVPAGVPMGCYVPVKVRAGGATSDPVTISTALSAGECIHPLGLSEDQLQVLDRGDPVLLGSYVIQATEADPVFQAVRSESAGLHFYWADARSIWVPMYLEAATSCSWLRLGGAGVNIRVLNFSLDAGPTATINGPNAKSISLPEIQTGYYSKDVDLAASAAPAPPFFEPGRWTVSVPGGAQIAGFQTVATIPTPVQLTNGASVHSFSRDTDLELTWDPQGFGNGDAISVFLQTWSFKSPPLGLDTLGITCTAAARNGRLVVPSGMLVYLPADSTGDRGTIQLSIVPNSQRPNVFAAPLVSGGSFPVVAGYGLDQWIHVAVR
jgi:uncharacterized protein (TIGR03437 family)